MVFYKKNIDLFVSCIIAVIIFMLMGGTDYLNIKNINVVMHGDVAQLYLSNMLFRWENWHGLSQIISIGYPDAGGTATTGSLSILGIILKWCKDLFELSPFYQFNGWWCFLNYILQAIASVFICRKLSSNKLTVILCSIFFIASPILISRIYNHEMLTSHWLILATLYIYLNGKLTYKTWFAYSLIALIGLYTHSYFIPMTFAIFIALVVQKIIDKSIDIKSSVFGALTLIGVFLFGYLGLQLNGLDASAGGYRLYSMNLNALFNPSTFPSTFLKDWPLSPGQYEGFQYLGFGLIIAFILALPYVIMNFDTKKLKSHFGIICVCLGLTFFALSTKIQFGNYVLLDLGKGGFINEIGGIFRAGGRFFWPVWYVLVFYILFLLFKYCKQQMKILLPILVVLQLIDVYPAIQNIRKNIKTNSEEQIELHFKSDKWHEIFQKHPFVIYFDDELWRDLWYIIPKENIHTSDGYFPRSYTRNKKFHTKIMQSLIKQNCSYFKDSVILVLANSPYVEKISRTMHKLDDVFYITGSELKECQQPLNIDKAPENIRLSIVQKINFFDIEEEISGLSEKESWGRWSEGKKTNFGLVFKNISEKESDIILNFEINPYINEKHRTLKVDVYCNDKYLTTWEFELGENTNTMLHIPREILKDNKVADLVFRIHNPKSPSKLGISEDKRKLGIGFISVEILDQNKKKGDKK